MPELVSILVPAYNAESWLAETLRSALAQTWPRLEVIVVDDGSKDRTLEVARTFESNKVKVVTQPNMGAPGTRNKAFDHAQGTYIQWLDADDLLDPRKIATQMAVAAEIGNRRVPLACPFGQFYYRPEKAIFSATSLWRDLTPTEYFLTRFNDNTFFQTDTWLVSRELSEAAGQWTDHDSPDDDGEYFCRVVMKSDGVKFVGDARTYYRIGNYGALNKARSARAQTALFGSKVKCIKYLMSLEDSPRSRAAAVRLLQDNGPRGPRGGGAKDGLRARRQAHDAEGEVEVSAFGMAVRSRRGNGRDPDPAAASRQCGKAVGQVPLSAVAA